MKLCGFNAGLDFPLFLIAGPCVIESRELAVEVAGRLKELCAGLGIPFIFKSSYDKANRSSGTSYRGWGMEKGLEIRADEKKTIGGPVVTVENHSPWRVDSLWAVTTGDSTRVPALAPGASAQVRVRAQAEDLLVLRGHASGHVLAPNLGVYVEGAGRYRVRAVIGESGAITVVETKLGGAAY